MSSSNMMSGFIDLATSDDLETHLYGGNDAVTYFMRRVRKSTNFTVVPVTLSKNAGIPQFNQQWGASVSRAGDFLLRSFLRVQLPEVNLSVSNNKFGANGRIRWTRNLMHALIREASVAFNDLPVMRFDNFYLDFWSQFSTPAGKMNGYNNMIGNIEELYNPIAAGSTGLTLPAATLNLPLPFFFSRDTGVALPAAGMPFNDMKLLFNFRDWSELLVLDDVLHSVSTTVSTSDLVSIPQLQSVDVWAEYAIVTKSERANIGKGTRDMIIEQVQTVSPSPFNPAHPTKIDLRLAHAIKALFFSVRNKTTASEWSNYTSASPVPSLGSGAGHGAVNFAPSGSSDPIATASLIYESTQRLSNMGSDYFSLVNPWYNAVSIPVETGYHLYSYSLDLVSVNPMGSTNFGKLSNVSMEIAPSAPALRGSSVVGTYLVPSTGEDDVNDGFAVTQVYDFILVAINHILLRIGGGQGGFPIL